MGRGYIYAVAAAVTWGLVYTIDQKILSNVSPLSLLFVDSLLSAVILLPFFFTDSEAVRNIFVSGRLNLSLILLSVVLACFANFFIFSAIKLIGASPASIIEIAYPFFVVLFSVIIYQTSPSIPFLIGGILIFIGSAIITYFH